MSFTTELPFRIPVRDQWNVVIEAANELGPDVSLDNVSLTLWPASHPARVPQHLSVLPEWRTIASEHGERAKPHETTFAEAALRPGHAFEPTEEVLTRCFDQGLAAMDRLAIEYSLATDDLSCRELPKEALPPLALVTFKDLFEPYYAHTFIRLHYGDAPIKRTLATETLEQIEARVRRASDQDGLRPYHEARVRATRMEGQGGYSEAAVAAATAIETLLFWVLVQRARDRGGSESDIEDMFRARGVVAIVRTQFHDWLGGVWDPRRDGSACFGWSRDLNDLRNQCVHRGYRPNHREAIAAIDAAKAMADFVFERIRANGLDAWLPPPVHLEDVSEGAYIWEHDEVIDR